MKQKWGMFLVVAAELPIIAAVSAGTGWNAGWVALGVFLVGTPALMICMRLLSSRREAKRESSD